MLFGRGRITRHEAGRGGRRGLCGRSSRTQKDVERLPTSHLFLLTPSLFLQPAKPLLLPPLCFFLLLMLPTLVEVLHHYPHKHVEDKEGHDQQEGDEVKEHPWIVVHDWLQSGARQMSTEPQKTKKGANWCCCPCKSCGCPFQAAQCALLFTEIKAL